jgi:primase-like protein
MSQTFPQPDRNAVATFVDCLFRYASGDTFISLRAFRDEKKDAPPLFIEPVKVGAPDSVDRICARIHDAAAHPEPHVFCPPVCVFGEPNSAAVENLAEGVALSVECDSGPSAALKKLTSILGKPTAIVASGGTWKNEVGRLEAKLHLHWRLAEPTRDDADHERLREARALAAELVGADKSATSIVHPLRWPGSWHRKNPSTPRIARLKTSPESEIELGDALERLREACPPKAHPAGNGHDRDEEGRDLRASLPELEAALGVLPNNATWDEWNRVGMATWVASNGQGFDAFNAWSKKNSKYDERTTKLRWNHYYQSPPTRIGAGTVFHLAGQVDSDWRSKIKIPEAPDWLKKELEKANQALAEQERVLAEQQRIDELARKSRVEYDRERKKAAVELKIRTKTLDDEVEKRRRQPGASTKKSPDDDKEKLKEYERAAGDLIHEPDILERFGAAVQASGLVGETANAKILYLAQTTRLFERPVSIAIKGISAGGKSFTVESVLKFFPSEAYFERTGLSEHALPYSDEDFRHRHIVIYEVAGMDSEMLSYFIRTLLSENRITYETVEKTGEGLKSRVIEKEGPTGLLTTTTAAALHPENETRILSLGVIDSPEQTAAVMKALGNRAASGDAPGSGVEPAWEALQRWLALGERRVVVPFAKELAEKIPPVAVRLRRDFGTLLALVRAHALLHRATRAADGQGRVIATLVDYGAVYGLVEKLFAEGVEATVPPTVRTTVEAVKDIGRPEISLTALAEHLKLEKSTVSARVHRADARGFLTNNETKKGLPARIALGDPLPEERRVLPPPEAFEGGCSGVRCESGGIDPHATPSNTLTPEGEADSGKSSEVAQKSAKEAEKQPETDQKDQKGSGASALQAEKPVCGRIPPESDRTPEHPAPERLPPSEDVL